MMLHVLPGDAYVETFHETGLEGGVAVFREALIEGDLTGATLDEFFNSRDRYQSESDNKTEHSYDSSVASEIRKMLETGRGDEINLWFEYELFCSVNYWFCLDLLRNSKAEIYRVTPVVRDEESRWKGFGNLTPEEMVTCWSKRVKVTAEDITRGSELWRAYKSGDLERVRQLGDYDSAAFPHLRDVADAASEIKSRPRRIMQEIMSHCETDFTKLFPEFSAKAGVYGFGDVQVRKLMDELNSPGL